MFEWFRKNCPHVDGKTEHAQFCDYWRAKPGKEGRKLDWVATWRRWMRTAEERSKPRTRGTPSEPPHPPLTSAALTSRGSAKSTGSSAKGTRPAPSRGASSMTMTSDEVWDLLELIASIDRRKVGLTDRQIWQGLIGDLSAADAQAAVIAHYRESHEWIMPSHVRHPRQGACAANG